MARLWPLIGLSLTLPLVPHSGVAEPLVPIPVEALFGNPQFTNPRLSKDGATIAVIRYEGDVQILMTRPVAGGAPNSIAQVKEDRIRVFDVQWVGSDWLLLAASEKGPKHRLRHQVAQLFSVPAAGGRLRKLRQRWAWRWGSGWRSTSIVDDLLDEPDHVLVEIPQRHGVSLQRLNVSSGNLRIRHHSKRGIREWHLDESSVVRAGTGYSPSGNYIALARADADSDFERIIKHPIRSVESVFAGFSKDPSLLYVLADKDGRRALYEWDLRTKSLGELVFAHDRVDVGWLVEGDQPNSVGGVRYVDDIEKVHAIDPDFGRFWSDLTKRVRRKFGPGLELRRVSSIPDRSLEIYELSGPLQPPMFVLVQRKTMSVTRLIEELPEVQKRSLSRTRPIRYDARDGLEIPGYLTLPKGRDKSGLPLIVLVHGGPGVRDRLEWNPEVQLLASRGYAVFQPNFRGSRGFGAAFRDAGDGEWGSAIQDDITDGVRWLVDAGTVDPDRIGIFGASFGGYASMMGLVKTPDLYRAGAGYAGVYDVEAMIDDDRDFNWVDHDWHDEAIGSETDHLRKISPGLRADEIQVPVLLAHGESDGRVSPDHSRKMHEALETAGKSVEYMEFPDEIHGFRLEKNRIKFYARLASFFDEHLVPRAQTRTVEP